MSNPYNPHGYGPPGGPPQGPGWGQGGYGYAPPGHDPHGGFASKGGAPGWGPTPGWGGGFQEYEFAEPENRVIDKTSKLAYAVGIVQLITALTQFLNANIIQAGVSIAVGIAFLGAGGALQKIVSTQGNDMHHMMQAVDKLSKAFAIRIWVMIIALILVMIIVAFVMLIGLAAFGLSR